MYSFHLNVLILPGCLWITTTLAPFRLFLNYFFCETFTTTLLHVLLIRRQKKETYLNKELENTIGYSICRYLRKIKLPQICVHFNSLHKIEHIMLVVESTSCKGSPLSSRGEMQQQCWAPQGLTPAKVIPSGNLIYLVYLCMTDYIYNSIINHMNSYLLKEYIQSCYFKSKLFKHPQINLKYL